MHKNFNELFYFFCSIQHLIEKLSKARIYLYDNNTFFFLISFVRIFSLLFLFATKTLVNNIIESIDNYSFLFLLSYEIAQTNEISISLFTLILIFL